MNKVAYSRPSPLSPLCPCPWAFVARAFAPFSGFLAAKTRHQAMAACAAAKKTKIAKRAGYPKAAMSQPVASGKRRSAVRESHHREVPRMPAGGRLEWGRLPRCWSADHGPGRSGRRISPPVPAPRSPVPNVVRASWCTPTGSAPPNPPTTRGWEVAPPPVQTGGKKRQQGRRGAKRRRQKGKA